MACTLLYEFNRSRSVASAASQIVADRDLQTCRLFVCTLCSSSSHDGMDVETAQVSVFCSTIHYVFECVFILFHLLRIHISYYAR